MFGQVVKCHSFMQYNRRDSFLLLPVFSKSIVGKCKFQIFKFQLTIQDKASENNDATLAKLPAYTAAKEREMFPAKLRHGANLWICNFSFCREKHKALAVPTTLLDNQAQSQFCKKKKPNKVNRFDVFPSTSWNSSVNTSPIKARTKPDRKMAARLQVPSPKVLWSFFAYIFLSIYSLSLCFECSQQKASPGIWLCLVPFTFALGLLLFWICVLRYVSPSVLKLLFALFFYTCHIRCRVMNFNITWLFLIPCHILWWGFPIFRACKR